MSESEPVSYEEKYNGLERIRKERPLSRERWRFIMLGTKIS